MIMALEIILWNQNPKPIPPRFIQQSCNANPANTINQPNVGPMLAQRRRRWPNIGLTLG